MQRYGPGGSATTCWCGTGKRTLHYSALHRRRPDGRRQIQRQAWGTSGRFVPAAWPRRHAARQGNAGRHELAAAAPTAFSLGEKRGSGLASHWRGDLSAVSSRGRNPWSQGSADKKADLDSYCRDGAQPLRASRPRSCGRSCRTVRPARLTVRPSPTAAASAFRSPSSGWKQFP